MVGLGAPVGVYSVSLFLKIYHYLVLYMSLF